MPRPTSVYLGDTPPPCPKCGGPRSRRDGVRQTVVRCSRCESSARSERRRRTPGKKPDEPAVPPPPCPHCDGPRRWYLYPGKSPTGVCDPCNRSRTRQRYEVFRVIADETGRTINEVRKPREADPPTPLEIYLAAARLRCEHRRKMMEAGGDGKPAANYEPRVYKVRG